MSKKKPTYYERKQKEQPVNKKAIAYIVAAFVAIVAIMTVLLILQEM